MLVLTRKTGERILLDISEIDSAIPPIEIVLIEAVDGKAKIGIEAVKRIKIVRSELEPKEM